jgi:hypothetical protein
VRHSLSQPSQHYAGLPPCPYAEAAWESGEVSVIVTDRLGRIQTLKQKLPPQGRQTYVIAWTAPHRMTPAAFDEWVERQNEQHNGVWLMGFHPDAEDEEGIEPVPVEIESDYAVILMQRLEVVAEAAQKLLGTGYYREYSDGELADLHRRDELALAEG